MTPSARTRATTFALAALAAAALTAATHASEGTGGRYTMTPADGAFIRLDTQSGAVSVCRRTGERWSCESVPDDRMALEQEVQRLTRENAELKSTVKRLEDLVGLAEQDRPGADRRPKLALPTEEDIDRAMSYVQRLLKKFKEKLRELEDPDGRRT